MANPTKGSRAMRDVENMLEGKKAKFGVLSEF